MKYRINYLASDGYIRHTDVEADNEEQAEQKAWDKDAETNSCGDNILKIISVE